MLPLEYILILLPLVLSTPLFLLVLNPALFFTRPEHATVLVLVLGDVGRSPRMMYHAESLGKLGWRTWVVGYGGSKPIGSLLAQPNTQIQYLPEPPKPLRLLPFIIAAPLKVLWQICSITYILLRTPTEVLLLQNPPSIPTLLLAQLTVHLRSNHTRLIIDWHNTGYSILGMKLGEVSAVVRLAKWFEQFFGQHADAHLFVTNAMKNKLSAEWDLIGEKVVMHDRPPAHFRRCGPLTMHGLFTKITPTLSPPSNPLPAFILPPQGLSPFSQIFTTAPTSTNGLGLGNDHTPKMRDDRPALIVSSTSWTPDEDFEVLLKALEGYEAAARARSSSNSNSDPNSKSNSKSTFPPLPNLLILISGKGPLLPTFLSRLTHLSPSWNHIAVRTLWLDVEDYPRFLGCADLGISLHQSSSGLDLPMKVVDLFGCGVPVLARGFACIDELVKDGKNGKIFDTSRQLTEQLVSILEGFPNAPNLNKLRSYFPDSHTPDSPGAHRSNGDNQVRSRRGESAQDRVRGEKSDGGNDGWNTWEEEWKRVVAPVILRKR